jgi:hypothetical protein
VPPFTLLEDVAAAIKDQLPSIDTNIRGSTIVAVDVEAADSTGFSQVVVFSSKSSATYDSIDNLRANATITVNTVIIDVVNVLKLSDGQIITDKNGNEVVFDDDFSFEANDDLFNGMTAEEVEAEYEKMVAAVAFGNLENGAGSSEESGNGAIVGAIIGGLIFIGLAIGGVYFMYERKQNGDRAAGRSHHARLTTRRSRDPSPCCLLGARLACNKQTHKHAR